MHTPSPANDPEAERRYIEYLRTLTPEQRAQITSDLTRAEVEQTWANLRRDNPDLDEIALKILFVRTRYGDELADQVAPHIEKLRNK